MQTWIIADPHFYHKNIIKYCNRPFYTVDEMNSELIRRWNHLVSEEDTIYVLGDFGFGGADRMTHVLSALKGHKVLVKGNHDRHRSAAWWKEVGFDEVYDEPITIEDEEGDLYLLMHEPEIENIMVAERDGKKVCFGHVHDEEMFQTFTKNTFCACVERWDYAPILLKDAKNIMKNCV